MKLGFSFEQKPLKSVKEGPFFYIYPSSFEVDVANQASFFDGGN
jgi:hypothetical protein